MRRSALGEVKDNEQCDDAAANRDNVMYSRQSERDQNGESGFRTISSRTQRVEAEDGDACRSSDFFRAILSRGEWLAKKEVDQGHGTETAVFLPDTTFILQ